MIRFASAVALGLVLAACAGQRPPVEAPAAVGAPGAVVEPNANLVLQGVPPVPARIAEQVAKYNDFRGHAFVDWHPQRREMLVSHRAAGASTTQLYRVAAPMAAPEPLTDAAEPVRKASYEPRDGRYIVFERSQGGDEAARLYRLDLPGRQVTPLTETPERHSLEGWLHGSSRLLTMSVPLDRTAEGGSRAAIAQTLRLLDPLAPGAAQRLAELPGGGWGVASVSWDDRQVALTRYLSASESQVWLLDLASGARRQLLPSPTASGPGAAPAVNFAGEFSRDNRSLFVSSDRGSEFRQLIRVDLADGRVTAMPGAIPWDVTEPSLNAAGTLLAAQANVDGRTELRFFDAASLQPAAAALALPPGSVGTSRFHERLGDLAFSVNDSQGPSQIWSVDPAGAGPLQWTQAAAAPGIDTRAFGAQTIVRWPSFDGRTISGILNAPPARFTGKRPVLIAIHGGPEAQATLGFMGRWNYLIDELGIAVIQPNVRGSAGYGKTFLSLDNGFQREDSVKDIGALLDWIGTQPGLDASRVAVTGGSYGGYMALAVATLYPERIAGAIDIVGISNFLTFLQNTESYRRDLRRVEYGDERDPAMRAFLERISPLSRADRIAKPLFVVQGKNDPRVPYTEAEQMVAKVRAAGSPVWYLRADNEGHGFARKENADFQFYATLLFLQQTLLGR